MSSYQTPVFDTFDERSDGVSFSDGIGMLLDPTNEFVFPILRAESTTVSVLPPKKEGDQAKISDVSGEQLTLVAGYQTRYNNRAVFAGSLNLCSDQALIESTYTFGHLSANS